MSCKTIQAKLSAYLDGEMSGSEMQSTRSHINRCQACQTELNGLKSVQMILRGLPSVQDPSEMLPARISQSIVSTKRTNLRFGLLLALPAVALAVVFYPRPRPFVKVQNRDLAINRQLAQDQIFDSGADSTLGASLVHYTNFQGR